ncbi:hypothetical protein C4F50_12710 [Flavobacterium sp. KB82]|uniref:Uncharacterized protein n=1 Tax=Flavobacterium hungaricum TaxID=2082725 RepID=A0ABR9TKB0_9FLAO|nr:hypothetical protein [Flavobacterium hungaricum]
MIILSEYRNPDYFFESFYLDSFEFFTLGRAVKLFDVCENKFKNESCVFQVFCRVRSVVSVY